MMRSDGRPPLYLYVAIARDDDCELRPAFQARDAQSEADAEEQARLLWSTGKYAGALAWWHLEDDLVNGDFGEPVVLYQEGEVPDMG